MNSGKLCGFSQTSPLGHRYNSPLSVGSFVWFLASLTKCSIEFQRNHLMSEILILFIFTGYLEDTNEEIHETYFSYFYLVLFMFCLS